MRNTIEKIFTELSTDATLMGYVKVFTRGGLERARLQWPFVNIGDIQDSIEDLTLGSIGKGNQSSFRFKIECGTKSTIPELAYFGDATTKGILHMCDDLRDLVHGNKFNGAFLFPAIVEDVHVMAGYDKADWICMAEMICLGRKLETRNIRC